MLRCALLNRRDSELPLEWVLCFQGIIGTHRLSILHCSSRSSPYPTSILRLRAAQNVVLAMILSPLMHKHILTLVLGEKCFCRPHEEVILSPLSQSQFRKRKLNMTSCIRDEF